MSSAAALFWIFAVCTCGGAIAVVVSQNVVRMAFWLMVSLGSVAGLFFLLRADFVAATQLMIYVGGTVVLLVFGVMLTASGRFVKIETSPAEGFLAAGIGSLFLAMILSTVAAVSWPDVATAVDSDFGLILQMSSKRFERHDPDGNGRIDREDLPKSLHAAFDHAKSEVHKAKDRLSFSEIQDVRTRQSWQNTPRSKPVVARKPVHAAPRTTGPLFRAIPDREAFLRFDQDHDGWISRKEAGPELEMSFDTTLRELGITQSDFQALLPGRGYNQTAQGNTARPIGLALLGTRADKDLGKKKESKLSTGYLLPFEIVSIHLLVVLIGAAYLARAKRRVGNRHHN